ncbi:hypothetical protein [Mangrovihabitans endophyticus]|uniref:ARB-07466-like C-terminal domain-containing protein n=1 Tax=Mangrovihabitans endophyticus TaxID=1751298 RepID=A0A8J3FQM7_9ACTN|nr:hypothetical protein [Mangrovihabitans endophyticus]GGK99554.1 hypothetical protein GCM10012284_37450 [Mangrovihabitans endophyticus]
MVKAVTGTVTIVIVACLGLPLLLSTIMGGTIGGCGTTAGPSTGSSGQPSETRRWDTGQLAIAATIIDRGTAKGVTRWGQTIALAVAMQESHLRNLPDLGDHNDHDSIGVFQQRPSQDWGTPTQLADPTYQADKFYDKLQTIPGWQTMPLTQAAQAVQASAHPNAYAKWTDDAVHLIAQHSAGDNVPLGCSPLAFGDAVPAPRNPDGSWPHEDCTIHPDPTTGTGCVTPRLLHLVQQATTAGFPKPACYRVDDHGEHPRGRACDWMMTPGGAATRTQKAQGDTMAAWAIANADRLAIMYIIWYRRIWTPAQGWHPYTNPWGGNDPSGWHTNHVHISVY